jgi:hypothetical protein
LSAALHLRLTKGLWFRAPSGGRRFFAQE